jgi:hypothetical protein
MADYTVSTEREVGEWPGVTVSFDTTKRHCVAVLGYRGATRRVVFAATPSDSARGLQNHIGQIRKELKGLGASRRKQTPSPHRERQRNKPVRLLTIEHHPALNPPAPKTGLAKLKEIAMATVAQIAPSGKAPAGTVHWLNECIERGKASRFSEEVMLTPGLAGELLRRNEGNRNVRNVKLAQYIADIAAGRWVVNGEPIIVSKDGQLNDGQHRCMAVIEANRPIVVSMAFGYDRATRLTIDQGAARCTADYLSMEGVRNAAHQAAIARLIIAYEANEGQSLANSNRITTAEMRSRVAADSGIDNSAAFGVHYNAKARYYVAATVLGFCHYVLSDIHEDDAAAYLGQVATGEGLKAKDPAYAVRERLLSAGKCGAEKKVHIIFRGWNAYRQGRKLDLAKVQGNLPAVL